MQKDLLNTASASTRGALLHGLAEENIGTDNHAVLALSGDVTDQETFTVGGDVYEIHQINTDTTFNVSGTEMDDTVKNVLSTVVSGVVEGSVLRIEDEFMIVLEYGANGATVLRGAFGSTAATHVDTTDIFEAAQAVGAGNLAVPVGATVTAAASDTLISNAVGFWADGYSLGVGGGRGLQKKAALALGSIVITDGVVFHYTANGTPVTVAEAMANATLSAFVSGQEPASTKSTKKAHVVVAGDVTAGSVDMVVPFVASKVFVSVFDGANNKLLSGWDGAVTQTDSSSASLIQVDNSGATDWDADDIIVVEAFE